MSTPEPAVPPEADPFAEAVVAAWSGSSAAARAPLKWVAKTARSCGVDAGDVSPTQPTGAGRPARTDCGTDGGEGYGWPLINRLADAVEVRPVPRAARPSTCTWPPAPEQVTRRHVVLRRPAQEAQLMCQEREPE
ncbi:hypothetical protein ACGFYU_05825 [Streptomyces sp. NPDC048337]|uniref:hypothetical protein n=1 Tax=Streptomyces sp. NPDC048337 TaxID=3365535 RepID=UPI00371D7FA4